MKNGIRSNEETQALDFFAPLSQAEKLTTPTFTITITSQCEEGVVNCEKVGYTGINRKTGKSISLEGRDLMHYCPDDQGDGPGKHLAITWGTSSRTGTRPTSSATMGI